MVYDMSNGGMQVCGCAIGRPCTCGYLLRRAAEEAPQVAVDEDELIEVAPGVVLRLKKEYENVPGTRHYRRMRQYRLSLRDAVEEFSAVISTANTHKKIVSFELLEVASRRKRLAEGTLPPSAGGKTLTKKELQDVQHMVSAYSDLSTHLKGRPPGFVPSTIPVAIPVLGPHLDHLHAQLTATIQKAKADLQGCKTFVHNYASMRIQAIARGRLLRAHHSAFLVTTWFGGELAAIVMLQCLARRVQARRRMAHRRQRHRHRVSVLASIHMQRTVRGYLGRKVAATKRLSQRVVKESNAVVTLQCWVRCLAAFRIARVRRSLRDAERRRVRRQEAAVDVQRLWRGHRGRAKARQARIQRNLSEPVRQLVADFQATGDLWAFVQAVDKDYRNFDMERQDEQDNASTFVTKVLRERMLHQERSLLVGLIQRWRLQFAWHASRAMESPVVAHQRRVDSAYESPLPSVSSSAALASPGGSGSRTSGGSGTNDSGGVVAPHSLFDLASDDAIHLHQIAPETIDLPEKYPPHVIRHAMTQGYSVDEVIAALRGLEAQHKSTRNVKLVLRELKRRAPLMLNAFKSERVVRQQRQRSPPKHPPPPTAVSFPDSPATSLSLSPTPDDFAVVDDKTVTTYLVQMLPDGLDEPMGKVTFAAAMLVFIPPLVDMNGDAAAVPPNPWTTTPNSHFAAYFKAPSALLQIRREQLVTTAIAPVVQLFKTNQIVHGCDLEATPDAVGQLDRWNVPAGLAHSIIAVLKHCRRRQQHLDPRNVRRQQSGAAPPSRVTPTARVVASPATGRGSTADTIAYDTSSRATSPATPATPPTPSSPDTPSDSNDVQRQFVEMKARIQATALTPVAMESSLFDLFFQALFVVVPLDNDPLSTTIRSDALDASHFDSFVYQLLDPALTMHASHRLLKRRSQRAATMARAFSNTLKAANCHAVKDIVHRSLDAFHVPDVVAEQVRACIGKVLFPPSSRDVDLRRVKSPKQLTKLTPLARTDSPLLRSRGKMQGVDELLAIPNLVDDDMLWLAPPTETRPSLLQTLRP